MLEQVLSTTANPLPAFHFCANSCSLKSQTYCYHWISQHEPHVWIAFYLSTRGHRIDNNYYLSMREIRFDVNLSLPRQPYRSFVRSLCRLLFEACGSSSSSNLSPSSVSPFVSIVVAPHYKTGQTTCDCRHAKLPEISAQSSSRRSDRRRRATESDEFLIINTIQNYSIRWSCLFFGTQTI